MLAETRRVPGPLVNYHRFLFQWHSRHFFRFRAHLSKIEMAYLEGCFALANSFHEVSETGYEDFSYYSYSHRVAGAAVNSSRLAYGSVEHPEEAWEAARPVLAERGLILPDYFHEQARFYGLGWDVLEEQFKVYFRVTRLGELPVELRPLVEGYDLAEHLPEGLASYTYQGGELKERKVYLYPKQDSQGALMLTDKRGAVLQSDVSAPGLWSERLSEVGQRILKLYAERGEDLDTIAFVDRDHYTMYFP